MRKTYASADGRVGHDGNVVLGARRRDAIVQNVRRKQAQLQLRELHGHHADRLLNRLDRALAERDAANLARVDVFRANHVERRRKVGRGVAARQRENVEPLGAAELREDVVDGRADKGGAGVGRQLLRVQAALDADDHVGGVRRVARKVLAQKDLAVPVGRAVKLGAAPEAAAAVVGGLHGRDDLVERQLLLGEAEAWVLLASVRVVRGA